MNGHRTANTTHRMTRGWSLRAYLLRHLQVFFYSLGRLSRVPISTLMTASVIGIALALPTALHVVLQNVERATRGWDGAAQISVFLEAGIGKEGIAALRGRLDAMQDIMAVEFISSDEALAEFRRHSGFGDALDALEENPLPSVLVVYPKAQNHHPGVLTALVEELGTLDGVDMAQLDVQWVKRLYHLMNLGRRAVLILGGVLALAVMLIVGNTIRLAIENRREEIEIIKLIGGTNAFIRRPFLYAGMWYGLLGGLLAWLLIILSLALMSEPVSRLSTLYQSTFRLTYLSVSATVVLLTVGTGLGVAGSWLAVGRHLQAIEPD